MPEIDQNKTENYQSISARHFWFKTINSYKTITYLSNNTLLWSSERVKSKLAEMDRLIGQLISQELA